MVKDNERLLLAISLPSKTSNTLTLLTRLLPAFLIHLIIYENVIKPFLDYNESLNINTKLLLLLLFVYLSRVKS